MVVIKVIVTIVFCIVASFFLYGMWLLEDDRYEYKKKHGVDPKYHGWRLDENEKDDSDKTK